VAGNVLDLDDGVVDQHADHQGQGQQRQHVEGVSEPLQREEGGNDRQRQRHRGDEGGAPVAQEQPDHQHREDRALDQRGHGVAVLLLGEIDGVRNLDHFHAGVGREQLRHGGARTARGGDFVHALRAHHLEADHLLAIEQGHLATLGVAVADAGNVGQAKPPAVGQRQRETGQVLGAADGTQRAYGLLQPAETAAATGRLLLHAAQLRTDLAGGDAQGLQAHGIQFDLHLAGHAALAVDLRHAAHVQQALADHVVDEPGQVGLVHRRRGDRIGQQRHAGDVDARHHRLLHFLGQFRTDARDRIAHVGDRVRQVLLVGEFHHQQHHAIVDGRGDMAHGTYAGDGILDRPGDFGFQLHRRGARHGGLYRHRRERHVRQVLDAETVEGDQARDRQHDEQQDRRRGLVDRPGREVHGAVPPLTTCTRSPSPRNAPPDLT